MDWRLVVEDSGFVRIGGKAYRMAESQEQKATNAIVDDLEQQDLLEVMLEETKPKGIVKVDTRFDYLLYTPFRYAPLPWGSRFGSTLEDSIFYASKSMDTLMLESAYYRFVYAKGLKTPHKEKIKTEHTVFSIEYKTDYGLKLQSDPFLQYSDILIDPSNYLETQSLGGHMKECGVSGFEYISARDPNSGINIGLFDIEAISINKPFDKNVWFCETSSKEVSFLCSQRSAFYNYSIDSFCSVGIFPSPAP